MKLSELKTILEHLPEDLGDPEVAFADFEPVRAIYGCQLGGITYICVTDNEMFCPSKENEENFIDYDELMHEQQERDAEFAEQYAEMMSDIF